jgi:RNA polymerase sigma-70 factor (ECF subfamily)
VEISRVLARIAAGERDAYAEIVQTYQRPLFGFLGRMGMTAAVAAEIAQETFLRAWKNIAQYQPGRADFSTWLFAIARNLALNELTRAASRHQGPLEHALVITPSSGPTPGEQVERQQSAARVRDALNRLSLEDRTTLALAYVQELPLGAIAALEGTTEGAVKTRLHRARARLRESLGSGDD